MTLPDIARIRLVVGLGNPGRKYAHHRHNVGFMVADCFAARHELTWAEKRKVAVASGRVCGNKLWLLKPLTYMNLCGPAVVPMMQLHKLKPYQVLVVYDELDLPLGTLRLRECGSAGGHKGMQSMIEHLSSGFPRLRLGIGRPPPHRDPADYVTEDFTAEEEPARRGMIEAGTKAIECLLDEGIRKAMSKFNRRDSTEGD